MESIFKACDVRGVYGQDLTEEHVRRIGAAVAVFLRRRGGEPRVVVGGDVRVSTPALRAALLEGLAANGARCVDLGVVPTPVFYFARRHLGVAAGVMVTASHNAARYNGLKLTLGSLPVTSEELDEVRALAETSAAAPAEGSVQRVSVIEAYRRWVLSVTRAWQPPSLPTAVRLAAPLVVLDPGNGVWSGLAADVFREAGYRVAAINNAADGRYPGRDPNPSIPEHLVGLGESVRQEKALLGVAFDGDGDRVAFVDELGRPLGADAAAVLLLRALLPGEPGARVVHDIKCSQIVPDEVRRLGGEPIMERSGHTFIRTRMIQENALFGPEASGHYFFRALEGGDDGLYCALVMSGALLAQQAPVSAQVDALPRYVTTPDIRVRYAGDPKPLLDAIAAAFPPSRVSRLDGVRVQFSEGWALARPSVTESALTLRFEGRTEADLARIVEAFLAPAPELRAAVTI